MIITPANTKSLTVQLTSSLTCIASAGIASSVPATVQRATRQAFQGTVRQFRHALASSHSGGLPLRAGAVNAMSKG